MDILPLTSDHMEGHNDADEPDDAVNSRRALLQVEDQADWCLFSIDVRNTYGLPFEVTFERTQEGA